MSPFQSVKREVGAEGIEQIRALLSAVLVSGKARERERERAREVGGEGVTTKPPLPYRLPDWFQMLLR